MRGRIKGRGETLRLHRTLPAREQVLLPLAGDEHDGLDQKRGRSKSGPPWRQARRIKLTLAGLHVDERQADAG